MRKRPKDQGTAALSVSADKVSITIILLWNEYTVIYSQTIKWIHVNTTGNHPIQCPNYPFSL